MRLSMGRCSYQSVGWIRLGQLKLALLPHDAGEERWALRGGGTFQLP